MSKEKLNINYWLRKFYVSKFFQSLPFSKTFIRKIVFTSIFKSKHWVQKSVLPKDSISVSGHGSNINTDQSENLINSLLNFFKKYEINVESTPPLHMVPKLVFGVINLEV